MKFASKDIVAPLTANEAARAILSMPIAFLSSNARFSLVALQGLELNSNLLIDEAGRWRGGYIPHHYFCHPFQMLSNNADQLILCVDEESEFIIDSDKDAGERFFDNEGNPAELVAKVVEFSSSYFGNLQKTAEICFLLSQHRLIKPWPLSLETSNGSVELESLYCIDEERLNNISATALKELRNSDALLLAYAQLFSMLNISLLVEQYNRNHGMENQGNHRVAEIDFESSESGGTISFENL